MEVLLFVGETDGEKAAQNDLPALTVAADKLDPILLAMLENLGDLSEIIAVGNDWPLEEILN